MSGHRVISDLHTHTKYSHGKGTTRQNVLTAVERGLTAVCVSEHGPGHLTYGVRGKKLSALGHELIELRKEFSGSIEVLRGLELNVTGFGKSDCPDDRDDYDVIIIGYHKGVSPLDSFARHIWAESLFGIKGDPRRNAEGLLLAAEACRADIISHPNLYLKLDIPYLAECARQLGILLEINSARVTMSADELRAVKAAGCGLIIGSDAHTPERVGDFALASAAADEADVWSAVKNAADA